MPNTQTNGAELRRFESATVQSLYDRYVGEHAERAEAYDAEVLNAEIARSIHDLRTKAGLNQRELATLVGTSASAICRLEDADYEGDALSLLKRIAAALGQRDEVFEALRVKLQRGAAEAERGELLDGDAVFEELRELIEERRRAKQA